MLLRTSRSNSPVFLEALATQFVQHFPAMNAALANGLMTEEVDVLSSQVYIAAVYCCCILLLYLAAVSCCCCTLLQQLLCTLLFLNALVSRCLIPWCWFAVAQRKQIA